MEKAMATSVKRSFRAENMDQFVSEGWKFRVKSVGKNRYIIRYRKKEEKSLGPYSDELWRYITEKAGGSVSQPRRNEVLLSEIEGLKERVKRLEGLGESVRHKSENCPQIGRWYGYTYCKVLFWEKKPKKLMQVYPQLEFMRIMPDRIEKKWYVKPHPDICRTCVMLLQVPSTLADDLHKVRRKIDMMDDGLDDVKSSLSLLTGSAERRVRDDHDGCKHIRSDGYCGWWYYFQRRWDRDQKEDTIMKKGKQKQVYRDNVRKHPLICVSCSSFEPRGSNT
jgi:hypothetical protein